MKLLLDFGNTRVKMACRTDGGLETLYSGPVDVDRLEQAVGGMETVGGLYCTVRNLPPGVLAWLDAHRVARLSCLTPVPLKVAYRTPGTLGMDRLAAVVGAWSIRPGQNLLVVDSGTAITYDFVSSDGCYVGGNIAPGLEMRFKSLNDYTDRLPRLHGTLGDTPLIGYDTETAIRSGVENGIKYEIEGIERRLSEKYGPVLVFLTGGGAECFEMQSKSNIFAVSNLVMQGLDCIAWYNETQTD